MGEVYVVMDNYEGYITVCKEENTAISVVNDIKRDLHNKHCVKKEAFRPNIICLCVSSSKRKKCAFHEYQDNIKEHDIDTCTIGSDDNVYYQKFPVM